MDCPKCGQENPDDANVCCSCGHVLTCSETEKRKPRFKTSKGIVTAFFLAGLSLLLAIFVRPTLAFLAALLGLLLLIVSVVQTLRGKKKLTAKRIVLGLFIILEMIFLTYWRIDAAPIPNDYTVFDLRSAVPFWYGTYTLLNSLGDNSDDLRDAPAIGLSSKDMEKLEEINNIFKEKDLQTISQQLQESADQILSIWKNAKKGRDILTKLASFPEIADLSEPDFSYLSGFQWTKNFRRLIYLHRAYICLQSRHGDQEAAIEELIKLDSIIKKMSLNARSLVKKLICLACFRINIETANFIVNNPGTPNEIVLLLKQRMIPFSDDHVSLRNPIMDQSFRT
jgi:energy-coupling factor transporter transmembrane protein EcfT